MSSSSSILLGVILIVVLVIGGYFGYQEYKKKPKDSKKKIRKHAFSGTSQRAQRMLDLHNNLFIGSADGEEYDTDKLPLPTTCSEYSFLRSIYAYRILGLIDESLTDEYLKSLVPTINGKNNYALEDFNVFVQNENNIKKHLPEWLPYYDSINKKLWGPQNKILQSLNCTCSTSKHPFHLDMNKIQNCMYVYPIDANTEYHQNEIVKSYASLPEVVNCDKYVENLEFQLWFGPSLTLRMEEPNGDSEPEYDQDTEDWKNWVQSDYLENLETLISSSTNTKAISNMDNYKSTCTT